MAQILTYIYVAAAVVLLFGAAIFIHEFGHFWVARKRGLKVLAFAVGFGPKMFGWTKDGIEYTVRWIPAGGYVKLPQMITSSAIEGGTEGEEKLPPISAMSKILVAAAGPFMNIVFAFAIATFIYFVGLPVLVNPPIIGKLDEESPEYKMGIREDDRIVEVNGTVVKSWQEITFETLTARTNVLPVVIERAGARKTYHLTAKPSKTLGGKWLELDPREHPVIGIVEPNMPAAEVGLMANDKFISFGGVPVLSQDSLTNLVSKAEGKPSEVVVQRNHQLLTFTITPVYDAANKRGRIGVGLGGGIYEVQRPGPTPWDQVSMVIDRTLGTLGALVHSSQTGVKPKDLSGPVGIFSVLAIQVKTDYRLALSFMVLLNVNLAILNLLPVPVLDGGHIVMAIIERIRRRPISVRVVEYVTTAFAALLISFMLYVTFWDVKRIPIFRSMFKRETQIEQTEKPTHLEPADKPVQVPQPVTNTPQ